MRLASFDEALAAVRAVAPAPGGERVPLVQALGRVTAEETLARSDVPNVDAAAMDGYACRADETAHATAERPVRLRVVGSARAGGSRAGPIGPGETVAIATGAALPDGGDAIVVVEASRSDGEHVLLFAPAQRKHVRRAGEELEAAVAGLPAGVRLDPFRLGLVAALGHADVTVARRPTAAVMATGPELVPPGETLGRGDVFDSNGPLIAASLRRAGACVRVLPTVADDPAALRDALASAGEVDLIVTTGGASVGRFDVVRRLLTADGGARFEGIAVRPGRPALLGTWHGTPWLALPGTPHAAALLGTVLLDDWTHVASGRTGSPPSARHQRARCLDPVRGAPDRTVLELAQSWTDAEGRRQVAPLARTSASRLLALHRADAVLVVPPGPGVAAGELVDVLPFRAAGAAPE